MYKRVSLIVILLMSLQITKAQYQNVVYNDERNSFNENQPLPVETYMILSGEIPEGIQKVDVKISNRANWERPLYSATWIRSYANNKSAYSIPLNYKLRSGSQYDFELSYYRGIQPKERAALTHDMHQALDAYLEQSAGFDGKSFNIVARSSTIVSDLDKIVEQGLKYYENRNDFEFEGFSDIIKMKIKQLDKTKVKRAKRLMPKAKNRAQARHMQQEKIMNELKTLVHTEIDNYLASSLLLVAERRHIEDYPTQKSRNELTINAGYGGAIFSAKSGDVSYGSSPYLGLSLPLGNRQFSAPFWSNMSLSTGVMINNLTDDNDNEVTGPIVGRPFYLGVGYKIFQFVNLQAGMSVLEQKNEQNFDVSNVVLKPFIGVGVAFNFWMDFAK